jgi:hypothetical protein
VSIPGRGEGELARWAPIGRAVRTGTWREQAEPTPARIELALAEGRYDDASELARHLVVEAQEIHDLYMEWMRRIPELIGREPADPAPFERDWRAFCEACERFATERDLERLLELWAGAHDRHLEHVADLVDEAVEAWGEDGLGELWAELQREPITFYEATYGPDRPWAESAARLLQVAIEGMHGHLGGPGRRGEVTVEEHPDRVSLSFHTCGSGGRILAAQRHGVVEGEHDFAWSTPGVCRYCVHCCVLQQLTPIDMFGYPARVIDPPSQPGAPCTWTVYRDPALVPESAYTRVGRTRHG